MFMIKRRLLLAAMLIAMMLIIPFYTYAGNDARVVLGDVISKGDQIHVPIVIRDVAYLSDARIEISLPGSDEGYQFREFQPAGRFDGRDFTVMSRVNNEKRLILEVNDAVKQTDRNKTDWTVGYLHFERERTHTFYLGEETPVSIYGVEALRNNQGSSFQPGITNGRIIYGDGPGDINGMGRANAGTAVKVLQHAIGEKELTGDAFRAADLNGDNRLNTADVDILLEYLSGNRDSVMSVVPLSSTTILQGKPFRFQLQVEHAQEPLEWGVSSGRLPTGLTLSSDGRLTGTPSRVGNAQVSITVTDRIGNEDSVTVTFTTVETSIKHIEEFNTVRAATGDDVNLPESVEVTYDDGRVEDKEVSWEIPVFDQAGSYVISGKITNLGIPLQIQVFISEQEHIAIDDITDRPDILGIHTFELTASDETHAVELAGSLMHYEGEGKFSLATTKLTSGEQVELIAYNQFGVVIDVQVLELP
ncbi:putative Ig domain-containing protein [Salisediminibacterium selenitireducens]|uniref:Ig family protein n=1 Tax=Bacillus selenitireducens (strain ATCC 700615 / DSM 15326 / MLS10) TaxID=439292 RepID=D6Y076_BACIE|nr:putative Ig domain-containing protein [Salisediminibacterium selenitireducens]ADH98467.1 Ig family protein [[Bacillus] selenitireducens MLS10]